MKKRNSIDFVTTTIYYVRKEKSHFIKLQYPEGEIIFPFHESMTPVFEGKLNLMINNVDSIEDTISPSLINKVIRTDKK